MFKYSLRSSIGCVVRTFLLHHTSSFCFYLAIFVGTLTIFLPKVALFLTCPEGRTEGPEMADLTVVMQYRVAQIFSSCNLARIWKSEW